MVDQRLAQSTGNRAHHAAGDQRSDKGQYQVENAAQIGDEIADKIEDAQHRRQPEAEQNGQLAGHEEAEQQAQRGHKPCQHTQCRLRAARRFVVDFFFRRQCQAQRKQPDHKGEQQHAGRARDILVPHRRRSGHGAGNLRAQPETDGHKDDAQRHAGHRTGHRAHEVAGGEEAHRNRQDRADGRGQERHEDRLDDHVDGRFAVLAQPRQTLAGCG